MRTMFLTMTLMVGLIGPISDPSATFAEESTNSQVLFTNVNIFDGKMNTLAMGRDVLVEGNVIKKIGKGLKANDGATVIVGGGRTLMPGLIDGHAHVMINGDYGQIDQ